MSVTIAHVGKVVEVSNTGIAFEKRTLVGIDPQNVRTFIVRARDGDGVSSWKYARELALVFRKPNHDDLENGPVVVEVSADGTDWKTKLLVGIDCSNPRSFICRAADGRGGWFWRHARMIAAQETCRPVDQCQSH